MSDSGLLARPARSPLLFVLVVCIALVLGVGSGAGSLALLAVGAGVSFVGGCWLLARGRIRDRLFGTLATVAGLLGTGASVALVVGGIGSRAAVSPLIAFGAVATASLAVTSAGCALVPADSFRAALSSSVRQAALAVGLLTPILALALAGHLFDGALIVFRTLPQRVSRTPSMALLTLPALALLGFVVLTSTETTRAILARRGYSVSSSTAWYDRMREWYVVVPIALIVYGYVWTDATVRRAIDSALVALDPVGHLVAAALTSGWPVTLGLASIAAMLALSAARILEPGCRAWLEPVPLGTLAGAAGGAIVSVGVLVGGRTTDGATVAPLATTLSASAWIVVVALRLGLPRRVTRRLASNAWRRRLVGLAACSLFGGTVIGSIAGLHPVGVVAGVAATVLVWDLGTHGLSMRSAVGADAGVEPARSHAGLTALVVAVGGVLAVGALGASRMVGSAVDSSLAPVAIGLTVLAVVVLAGGSLPAGSVRGSLSGVSPLARSVQAMSRLQAIALSIPIWLGLAAAVDRRFVIVAITCLVALVVRSPGRWRRFDDWVERY
ncbi:hypothetical protein [Halovivax limisalsi]|uniref:hypothetical protein n=1 Tax=Halovivax limisalsi TaxID=1453760 RepID=UPI001FFCF192|nr:hypothetical protein [Halovivax limisalsi]